MRSVRITCGALSALVLTTSIVVLIDAPSTVGRMLGTIVPSPFSSPRPRFTNTSALVDVTATPPRYLGVVNRPPSRFTSDDVSSERVLVTIGGAGSVSGGVWAPTQRRTELRVTLSPVPVAAESRLDEIAREAVRGLGRDFSGSRVLDGAALLNIHIDPQTGVSDTAAITRTEWSGYVHDAVSALAFGGLVWAIWPRRKAPPVSMTTPA